MPETFKRLARALRDDPRWVDVRGMLLSGRCKLVGGDESSVDRALQAVAGPAATGPAADAAPWDGLVASTDFPLVALIGRPLAPAIARAAALLPPTGELLVQRESLDHVVAALPGWTHEAAHVHRRRSTASADPGDPEVQMITQGDAPRLEALPAPLRREIENAMGFTTVAVWNERGVPVSFCYAAVETETLWDVSVDTLAAFRGRGLAGRCFRSMAARMRERGKQAVWSALASNTASLRAAAKLGFQVVDRFFLFRRGPGARRS